MQAQGDSSSDRQDYEQKLIRCRSLLRLTQAPACIAAAGSSKHWNIIRVPLLRWEQLQGPGQWADQVQHHPEACFQGMTQQASCR